jgi:phage-related protein
MGDAPRAERPLLWIASSRRDYQAFPGEVQRAFGFALHLAQVGLHPPLAKPLKGFGAGAVELVEDFDGDAYRAVYTVRFAECVYVLHAFKKKSKQGIRTPQSDLDLIRRRLRDAEADHRQRYGQEGKP